MEKPVRLTRGELIALGADIETFPGYALIPSEFHGFPTFHLVEVWKPTRWHLKQERVRARRGIVVASKLRGE